MDEDTGKFRKTGNVVKTLLSTHDTVIYGAWYDNVCRKYQDFTLSGWKGTNADNQKFSQSHCQQATIRPFGA